MNFYITDKDFCDVQLFIRLFNNNVVIYQDCNVTECTCDQELENVHESVPSVKVVNMEVTASGEGGQKLSRPTTPTILLPPHRYRNFHTKINQNNFKLFLKYYCNYKYIYLL